jgi:cytochrome c peroxidase
MFASGPQRTRGRARGQISYDARVRDAVVLTWLAAGLLLPACEDSLVDGMFTDAEWHKINTFSPLPDPPPSPTNRFADNHDVAELGQRLWFEKRYAGKITEGAAEEGALGAINDEQKVSCSDCHNPAHWFTDTRSVPNTTSLGTARTNRNAPSMVNAVYYEWGNWAGSHDQFWKQGANSSESRDNFNSDRLRYVHIIYDYYRDHYNALFDPDLPAALDPNAPDKGRFPPSGKPGSANGAWEGMTRDDQIVVETVLANCGKALEAYERRLVSRDAPFDRYVAGDYGALTTSAKRGLKLFIGKAGCESCHEKQTFTDQEFHNTGVPQMEAVLTMKDFDNGRYLDVDRLPNTWNGAGAYSDDPDAGREKLARVQKDELMIGKFRTKSLRHVAETGPYFHNGIAATLADVVRFYNDGGGLPGTYPGSKAPQLMPLNLTEAEIEDIVEFLRSLTGAPIPEELTMNTAAIAPVGL